jgi:predicted dithiol-disulfide oxidoreductase (DUF899 family)
MEQHKIVSHADWLKERVGFLNKEKEFTRLRDELSAARRAMPWEKIEKDYVFDGPNGKETLAQLFDGRSQLVVYHFMLGPDAKAGCHACSWWADNIERNVVHLAHRDTTVVLVSRGQLANIDAFKKRMGWTTKWVSSHGNDFNFDYGVSFKPETVEKGEVVYNYKPSTRKATEMPGISVFYKDPSGQVFHTYSCYERGLDMMNAGYHFLDLTPKGRDEAEGNMKWLRHRDAYDR